MLVALLLVLGAATAAPCNKPCLDLCLPYHSENYCFTQCDCKASHTFPAQIVTEDGRKFAVAPVPPKPKELDDNYRYLGCKVECADLCFRFAVGYAQLNCVVGHCGCQNLITEIVPPPVYQPPTYAPAPAPVYQPPTYAPAPAPVYQPPTYAPAPAPAPATPAPAPVAQPPAPVAQAPAPVAQAPAPAAPAPAPQPAPAAGTVKVPFTTKDGRNYEITPMVPDNVFFQGCAACVDTCSRLTSLQLVEKCLTFCSCQTSVAEVPARPF